jgi:excisionase family DNA binding protein
MTVSEDVILDCFDAAKLCRLSPATMRKLADTGKIPARRLGLQWRFSRKALIAWCAGESTPVEFDAVSGQ